MAMKPTDQEIGMLYREGGAAEPSAELDRRILMAARAAVATKPPPSPWWTRWRLPVQALASVALVGMLVLMVDQKQPDAPVIGAIALNAPPAEAPRAEPEVADKAMPAVADNALKRAERAVVQRAPVAPAAPAAIAPREIAELESVASPAPMASAAPIAAARLAPKKPEVLGGAEVKMEARQVGASAAYVALPPKEWLESIQKLIAQERIEEAKVSLEAFERANPAVVVPEDIRKQLK